MVAARCATCAFVLARLVEVDNIHWRVWVRFFHLHRAECIIKQTTLLANRLAGCILEGTGRNNSQNENWTHDSLSRRTITRSQSSKLNIDSIIDHQGTWGQKMQWWGARVDIERAQFSRDTMWETWEARVELICHACLWLCLRLLSESNCIFH